MEKENIKFKIIDDTDIESIAYLHNITFKKGLSLSYFQIKYSTSLFQCMPIASIAYHQDKPIAFYGAIPQVFEDNKTTFLVAHTCDSITLPAFQRKGIHYQLAQLSYQSMKDQGFKFAYAFHSENTYYSCKKLGWKDLFYLQVIEYRLPIIPIQKILWKTGLKAINSKLIKHVFDKYVVQVNEITNPLFNEGYIAQQYNANCLAHRSYLNHFFLSINNCIVWVKFTNILHMGLVSFSHEKEILNCINQIKKLAKKSGFDKISWHISDDSVTGAIVQKQKLTKPSWLVGYIPFDTNLPYNKLRFNYADLDSF